MGIGINTLPAPAIKHLQTHYNRRLEYGRGCRVVQLQPGDWHRKMAAICLLVLVDNKLFSSTFRIFTSLSNNGSSTPTLSKRPNTDASFVRVSDQRSRLPEVG